MAEELSAGGVPVKVRHPFGPLLLGIITLGIYMLVWYYKVNKELFEYTGEGNPAMSLVAILFGWIIIVPPFVSAFNTGERIAAAQARAGAAGRASGVLSFVLFLIPIASLFWAFYLQTNLNEAWNSAAHGGVSEGMGRLQPD